MSNKQAYMPADERRAATVQAVIDLSAQQNPAAITTNEIAQKMGLTQGALFRHFPNKESMLEATMQWVSQKLLGKIDRAIKNSDKPIEALESMFMAHIDFIQKHPGVPRMLFGELQKPEPSMPKKMVQTLLMQYQVRLKSLLEQAVSNKELSPNIKIETASIMFLGMIQGLVMQTLLTDQFINIKKMAPDVFNIYIRGLGAQV